MPHVLGLHLSVERLRKRSVDYTPSTSSSPGYCLPGSVVNYAGAEKGTGSAQARWATRLTHRAATPAAEGEEKPNMPTPVPQTGELHDCCFIHGPKLKPKTLLGRQEASIHHLVETTKSGKSV